jgi:polyisoprenoid-binding protein YceI
MCVGYSRRVKTLFCLPLLFALVAEAGAATQRLMVDRVHSQVEVAVHATVDSFTAKLGDYDAQIDVDPATAQVTGAQFRFRFADLKTGKERRDREMHEWQRTEEYPEGEFVLATLEPAAEGRFTARGKLRLHGVVKEISFPVSVTTDHTLFAVDGSPVLDTRDFGLPVIRKFALLKVDPIVTVRFHLQASLPAENNQNGAKR